MKCINCGQEFEIEQQGSIINVDGDGVCSYLCKQEYVKKQAYFLGVVIHDDNKMAQWWKGEI